MAQPIHWFPGHMAKTLRLMRERLRLVDLVIETCDARIPASSRNPEFEKLLGEKMRLLVLCKKDLADSNSTDTWIDWFSGQGVRALASNNLRKPDVEKIRQACLDMCKDRIERAMDKGRLTRPVRVMVVGIPNTGKSTLINTLSGRAVAKTEDRPGVTRSPQWVRTQSGLELMDMPGALWPKVDNTQHQLHLAATGAIKEEVLDVEEIAFRTLDILQTRYPMHLEERFGSFDPELSLDDLFTTFARKRGCVLSGGRIDASRFSTLLLDEFRSGKIGRITLEMPE